jgi:hypothetical protein
VRALNRIWGDGANSLALRVQRIGLQALDWIELDTWKKIRGSTPATKFPAVPDSSRSKTIDSQGSFPLGRISDLQEPKMPISGLASRRQQTAKPR